MPELRCYGLRGASFFLGGGGAIPADGNRCPAPIPGPKPSPPAWRPPPASFRAVTGGIISYRGGSNSAHHRYASMNLFGCRSPAEAGDRLDGRLRIERPALTPCARWGSKSRPPSRRTAGLSPERRLLSARAERDVTTKRGATTEATEPAGVVALIS